MAANPGSNVNSLQNFIHALEQGKITPIIRASLALAAVVLIATIYLWNFRGFATPEAMDQAQIARQIATGHGWSTKLIRPLAIWQIKSNLGAPPKAPDFPDTFNAPLPPLVNALTVKLAGPAIKFAQNEYIMPVERYIAALSIILFLLSTVVQFFLLRRLFDQRLALWSVALILVCDMCWQFALSGLPQMLMLLLFNLALYALTRAVEMNVAVAAAVEGHSALDKNGVAIVPRQAVVFGWLAAVGILFGLLVLAHGLAGWLFAGLLIFAGYYFRDRGRAVLVLLATFLLVYGPWMVRTYHASGNPFGVAIYTIFEGVNTTTVDRMRSADGPMTENIQPRSFRPKTEAALVDELDHLLGDLGGDVVALAFFVGLLHVFRRREVGGVRQAVLIMWVVALVGTAATRSHSDAPGGVGADQLEVLFLPVMLGHGLAFVLVLFSRREIGTGFVARVILFSVLLVLAAIPMVFALLPHGAPPVQYPPYFEPAINKLAGWTRTDEIIGSDMPWAVAWYADRESMWIPLKLPDFMSLSDNGELNGALAGIFLTPISRNTPFLTSLYKGGDYYDYQAFVFGRPDVPLFPFHEQILIMGDLSYTFVSDSKRWEKTEGAHVAP